MEMKFKTLNAEVKDLGKNTISAVFSTETVDRHGDVVKQNWDLRSYMNNPVILNSHRHDDAGEVVGKATRLRVAKDRLEGDIQFAVNENPKAKVIYELYKGGYLNSFSVGFVAKEANWDEDNGGFVIEESELLEISTVSVPANPEALALAKSKGIDVDLINEFRKYEKQDNGNESENTENGADSECNDGADENNVAEQEPITESEGADVDEQDETKQEIDGNGTDIIVDEVEEVIDNEVAEVKEETETEKRVKFLEKLLKVVKLYGESQAKEAIQSDAKTKINKIISELLKIKKQ